MRGGAKEKCRLRRCYPKLTRSCLVKAAAIVPEPLFERDTFLFFPPFKDCFPPSVVHIGGRDVPDSFVIAAMIVKLDELRDRSPQPGLQAAGAGGLEPGAKCGLRRATLLRDVRSNMSSRRVGREFPS
jgi:hypothetical protein